MLSKAQLNAFLQKFTFLPKLSPHNVCPKYQIASFKNKHLSKLGYRIPQTDLASNLSSIRCSVARITQNFPGNKELLV